MRRAAVEGYRLAHALERKLIEHRDVRAGGNGLAQLVEIFHLHLDRYAGRRNAAADARAPATAKAIEPAAMMWFSLMRMASNNPDR